MIGKKIVCMRKMLKKIVCPRGASGKKLSAETTYVMQNLGNLKKIVCTVGVEEKNL